MEGTERALHTLEEVGVRVHLIQIVLTEEWASLEAHIIQELLRKDAKDPQNNCYYLYCINNITKTYS